MIAEINILCLDGHRYRYQMEDIQHYDLEYCKNVTRIDFKDGSFIEFTRSNIICVELVSKQFFEDGGAK